MRDLFWLVPNCARGLFELARARIAFAKLDTATIKARNDEIAQTCQTCKNSTSGNPTKIARVAYVLPRLSARLPWRSDCLIQAMAGQEWLFKHNQPSQIVIGVQNSKNIEFGAHAWLLSGEQVVTGGNISEYLPILGDKNEPEE